MTLLAGFNRVSNAFSVHVLLWHFDEEIAPSWEIYGSQDSADSFDVAWFASEVW